MADMTGLPTLEAYLGWIARHALVLVVCSLLGGLVGVGLVVADRPQVTAEASVLLSRQPARPQLDPTGEVPPEVTIDTDAALLGATEVTAAVALSTGTDPEAVEDRLEVRATPLTRVLHVSFSAPDEETAEDGARAAVTALLEERVELIAAAADPVARMRQELARLRDKVEARARDTRTTSPENVLLSRLQARVSFLSTGSSGDQAVGRVLRRAGEVGPASRDNPEVKVSGGAMAGLLLGLGVGIVLDARRGFRRSTRAERPVDQRAQPQRGLARG
jgi:uncharacterized protein involved in exopolysaccharide biosynthesis